MTAERPCITVAVHDDVPETELTQVLLGMEEEGIPSRVERSGELDPLQLAHRAATASLLEVGVGIALGYVVVTTGKLPPRRPCLADLVGRDPARDRLIGADAARLVKRLPLRTVPVATAERSR